MRRKKIVLIHWKDATGDSKWENVSEITTKTPICCQTVGFLLKRTKNHLIVAHSILENDEADYTTIPMGCVEDIRVLDEV